MKLSFSEAFIQSVPAAGDAAPEQIVAPEPPQGRVRGQVRGASRPGAAEDIPDVQEFWVVRHKLQLIVRRKAPDAGALGQAVTDRVQQPGVADEAALAKKSAARA